MRRIKYFAAQEMDYRYQLNMWYADIFLVVLYTVIATAVILSISRSTTSRYICPNTKGFPKPVTQKPSNRREEPGKSAREIQSTNINCSKCDEILAKIDLEKRMPTQRGSQIES
ncbi:uncharacterized protein [Halyomorpha halys]|uniref:uncharacterized protein n=1 Tax=Halyomorpha halys TaxID=286706 RepID=UPI0006D51A87|nr:uncharacterized protein LOC106684001 [Halyomorpha halys]